jgi:hypothetical protein
MEVGRNEKRISLSRISFAVSSAAACNPGQSRHLLTGRTDGLRQVTVAKLVSIFAPDLGILYPK